MAMKTKRLFYKRFLKKPSDIHIELRNSGTAVQYVKKTITVHLHAAAM